MSEKDIKEISFDGFRVDAERRLLLKDGEAVPLKAKTFDLLLTLVENRGQLLTKNELLDLVWENQFVAENNLSVHIAALRKALGETKEEHRFIVTVPGKGYQFVGVLDPSKGSNGAGGHELVVERHRVQRIVVENNGGASGLAEAAELSRFGVTDQTLEVRALPAAAAPAVPSHRRLILIGLAAVVVLAALGSGYFLIRRWARRPAIMPFAHIRIRQLTTNGKVGNAALSPNGKLFAYTVDDLGQKSLWLGFVAGGTHRQLRDPADATIRALTFSPDGSQLFFLLRDEKHPRMGLYRIPASGGVEILVREGVSDFSLAPDGNRFAFARSDKSTRQDSIVISSVDGGGEKPLASFPQEASFDTGTLSWSPDGNRLAVALSEQTYGNGNRLAIMDLGSGRVEQIMPQRLLQITRTEWLKDGNGLIITGADIPATSSVTQYRLFLVSYPGGQTSEITPDRSNYGESWNNDAGVSLSLATAGDLMLTVEHRQLDNIWIAPANDLAAAKQISFSSFGKYDGLWGLDWAPDGTLYYTTSNTESCFIANMKADGSGVRNMTPPGFNDGQITVSADGRYVLFSTNRGGGFDIWRIDRDGTNLKQLTFGGHGYHAAPSQDGKWVYYKSNAEGSDALFRVPMDGGAPEQVTKGPTWWPSFSPDGKYFSAIYATDKNRLAIFSAATNELIKQFDLPRGGTLYMGSRWTPDSQAVTFRDKNYGYWIQPIDGGEAHRLEGLPKERLYNFSWSRDGKWLAFVRGPEIRDVVLIENSSQ
jgi:Tol biopolymer transport system component/DNA-binding winged helix-turn-helix (wHTH) protein